MVLKTKIMKSSCVSKPQFPHPSKGGRLGSGGGSNLFGLSPSYLGSRRLAEDSGRRTAP